MTKLGDIKWDKEKLPQKKHLSHEDKQVMAEYYQAGLKTGKSSEDLLTELAERYGRSPRQISRYVSEARESGKPHPVMDFNQISGPLSSKQDNFQELCSQLVLREYPEAKPVEGKGGDGILRVVWQAKFFCDPLKEPQKCQIKDSFGRVRQALSITRWILCLPRNLNTAEQEWFDSLNRQPPGLVMRRAVVFLEWWGETKLHELLAKHPDIALKFFPALGEQRPEDSLIVHSLSTGGASIEFMLSNLSNNVLLLHGIVLEVLQWQPFDLWSTTGAKVMTYKYEVELRPRYVGEYRITDDEFNYARGDVDGFAIICKSPPGNKYTARVNFYCSDLATNKKFTVNSANFDLWFYKKRVCETSSIGGTEGLHQTVIGEGLVMQAVQAAIARGRECSQSVSGSAISEAREADSGDDASQQGRNTNSMVSRSETSVQG